MEVSNSSFYCTNLIQLKTLFFFFTTRIFPAASMLERARKPQDQIVRNNKLTTMTFAHHTKVDFKIISLENYSLIILNITN